MTKDPGDLFTGTDDTEDTSDERGEVLPNDQPPLDGGDEIGIRAWLRDLTYDEVHAFTVGFAPMFAGLLLLPFAPAIGTALLAAATGLAVVGVTEKHAPTKTLRYIVREVHYFLGGLASATLMGVAWVGLVAIVQHLAGVVL